MSKIAVFVTTDELYHTTQHIAELFTSNEILLYRVTAATVARIAEEAEAAGCQVIVARRTISRPLAGASITIPVIQCSLMQGELLEVLSEAKQKTGLDTPHICFFNCEQEMDRTLLSIELCQRLLKIKITIYDVDIVNPETIHNAARKAVESHADILVASTTIYAYIENYPIPTHRLSGSHAYESMINALRVAELVADTVKLEQQRNRDLMTIIQHSFDAVIYIDAKGNVILMNTVAEHAFSLSSKADSGKKIWGLIPQINRAMVENVLDRNGNVFGTIIEVNQSIYITNITAVRNESKTQGAIIHFNELERIEQLEAQAKTELYRKGHVARYQFDNILGKSGCLSNAKYISAEFAKYDSTILILGESGTGKEMFAQSIHNQSARRNNPFVAINCAAMPLNLLESELFGYAEGAFTGAVRRGKKGLFEIANTGTVFLDEISELNPSGQVRLLRVLAEKCIRRVGDDVVIPVNVRIIAATNRNLAQLVEEKKFREDLYYRLNVLTVEIPPLRERHGDIRLLANHFISFFGSKTGKYINLSEEAYLELERCSWKGNVRQLRNFCERLVIIARQNEIDGMFARSQLRSAYGDDSICPVAGGNEDTDISRFEKQRIIELLEKNRHSRKKVAEAMQISKSTLWRKMKEYNLL